MTRYLIEPAEAGAIPLTPLTKESLPAWLEGQRPEAAAWVRAAGFDGAAGALCLLPGPGGALARVLAGIDPKDLLWSYAALPGKLGKLGCLG